jgi:hypothetical protein
MKGFKYHKPQQGRASLRDGVPIPSEELPELVAELQGGQREVLLGFSGKDSLAAWLFLLDHGFKVHPYWCYLLPDRKNDNIMLDYYEKHFKTHIIRLPHPQLLSYLDQHYFMDADGIMAWENLIWEYTPWVGEYGWDSIEKMLVEHLKLNPVTYCAVGMRAADSLDRSVIARKRGPLGQVRYYWWAVWDWNLEQVLTRIRKSGLKVHHNYSLFGSTGDTLVINDLRVYKEKLPEDYARIKQIFKLIDLEFFRREKVK